MYVKMLVTVGTLSGCLTAGKIYDLEEPLAARWIRERLAERSETPPDHVARMLARLEHGAGRPCLFLPFIAEFGHMVMTHIRQVHFHKASRKVVCCRRGQEVLFPSADEFVTEWEDPLSDVERVGTGRNVRFRWSQLENAYAGHVAIEAGNLTPTQELFCLHPNQPIPFNPRRRGLSADVALGVRRRDFCPERNWPNWQRLADALAAQGITYAVIGDRATSYDLDGQVCHSGNYDTDAAVELLQNAKLYIGGDSGNSHLASTVGVEMLLFREEVGRSRDLTWRMKQVNPGRVDVLRGVWERPQVVIDAAIARLNGETIAA